MTSRGSRRKGTAARKGFRGRKPVITVSPGNENIGEATDALHRHLPGALFERGGVLVQLVTRVTFVGVAGALLKVLGKETLLELLLEAADWQQASELILGNPKPVAPPSRVVQTLLKDPAGRFPPVLSVVTAPTLLPSGSLLDKPGYDPASAVLVVADGTAWPSIPDRPSTAQARAALEQLLEVFHDFEFREECDRSAAVAAVLTVVARPGISGQTPGFAFSAPTQGTGKTLLTKVTGALAVGSEPPMTAWPHNQPAEQSKVLLSLALEAAPLVVFDNVRGVFSSSSLASAITSGEWQDRVLGLNRMAKVPFNLVVLVTGNNLQADGDLGRRLIPIELAPKVEHPDLRRGFLHDPLLPWVKTNRPRLVAAALTILREFVVAGRPVPRDLSPYGSFEDWSDLVRGSLVRLGMADPLQGNLRLRVRSTPERDSHLNLLASWHRAVGVGPVTVKAILSAADAGTDVAMDLRSALHGLVPPGKDSAGYANRVGIALRSIDGRTVGEYRLDILEQRPGGKNLYQVAKVTPQATVMNHVPEGPGPSGGMSTALEEDSCGGGGSSMEEEKEREW